MVTDTIDGLTRTALSCMLRGAAGGKPMSIDAEEAAIRTVIVSALMGHAEAGERDFDTLFAMRQAEAIVKALKIGGYEIIHARCPPPASPILSSRWTSRTCATTACGRSPCDVTSACTR